jgi:hypothetical protein
LTDLCLRANARPAAIADHGKRLKREARISASARAIRRSGLSNFEMACYIPRAFTSNETVECRFSAMQTIEFQGVRPTKHH